MSTLSFIEKREIESFLGFKDGYIFYWLVQRGDYNKNVTYELIKEAVGIDIYNDINFKNLGQAKCIEKIFREKSDVIVGKLLKKFLEFYKTSCVDDYWEEIDRRNYESIDKIAERLLISSSINLPDSKDDSLQMLQQDITRNFNENTPELVLDRLHTFSFKYIRQLSENHNVNISTPNGDKYPLDTMVANLIKWYRSNNYFSSEFIYVALRNTINIFSKFNDIRNNRSFAHDNTLLDKYEAGYVVKIVSDTLVFLDQIEHEMNDGIITLSEEECPFL